jgi:hypothetical protein
MRLTRGLGAASRRCRQRRALRGDVRVRATGNDPYTLEIEVASLTAGEAVNLGAGLNHARPISRSQSVGSGHAALSVAKQQPPICLCQDRLRAAGVPKHDRLGSPGQVPTT